MLGWLSVIATAHPSALSHVSSPVATLFVRSPGYGYAKASLKRVEQWNLLMGLYLRKRHKQGILKRVLVLIDIRRRIGPLDEKFMQFLEMEQIPYQVVLTKCDLLAPLSFAAAHEDVRAHLRSMPEGPFAAADEAPAATAADEAPSAAPEVELPFERRWWPGQVVVHAELGPGGVWGRGLGRVTVRFEGPRTAPGPVRTLSADDPLLQPADPPDWRMPS